MLDIIKGFVMLNLVEVVGTAIVVLIGLILYKRGKTDFVHRVVLALVTEAEKRYGDGTGDLKYHHVVERLYEVLPWILRVLYSKEQIDKMIEDSVEYLKRYLAEGKDLLGHE
ncbi:hypothetical protein SAMN05446037_100252 [Anaerovirgula multivorans]|uniref:Phage holin, LL-H family n=1 Tax=Anaerovirgula multivorans TaxID=312168 RepID=A0A239AHS7_9FIRM|nr:hypothetical protein [Anaerovirgula multivorans]SNR95185.1 hypothetical protein SAMN05446037_100252 [Anaerovirgula multivorans]